MPPDKKTFAPRPRDVVDVDENLAAPFRLGAMHEVVLAVADKIRGRFLVPPEFAAIFMRADAEFVGNGAVSFETLICALAELRSLPPAGVRVLMRGYLPVLEQKKRPIAQSHSAPAVASKRDEKAKRAKAA